MTISKVELLLHPVRMQIVTNMAMQRMTARDLSKILDIPQTTLYRHINILVEGEVLKIVEENQIRGTVERVYQVATAPSLNADDLRGMRKDEYEQLFLLFISTLVSDVQHYLATKTDEGDIQVLDDGVELNKVKLFLSDEEYTKMNTAISKLMIKAIENGPSAERTSRMFSYMFIPGGDQDKT